MKKILLLSILSIHLLQAEENEKDLYLQYLNKYKTLGPFGKASEGEIEIILDKEKIAEIERSTGRKVGIVANDKYWIWINDAVYFPSGKSGVYGRVMWQQALRGLTGVAVMVVLPDGRIVLNRNYRHATRSWEYELPRGASEPGETIEAVALREVKEETGMVIDQLILLGEIAPDTGMVNAVVPVVMAKLMSQEEAAPEDSEAIAGIEAFTVKELKQGYIEGYLIRNGKKIPLRDPFLAFALFQADLRHLFDK
jgi:ADP-ribose pyrophosphatase